MAGNCPDCGESLSNAYSCVCGWRAQRATNAAPKPADRRRADGLRLCEYADRGEYVCDQAGSMAFHTHAGGPWFCGAHWDRLRNVQRERNAPPRGFQAIRDLVNKAAPDEADLERAAMRERTEA